MSAEYCSIPALPVYLATSHYASLGKSQVHFWEPEGESNPGTSVFHIQLGADLGKHRFAMLGHHAALVTVEGNKVAVECFLGVLKYIVELCSTPLKDAAEVAWDQGPANGCRDGTNSSEQKDLKSGQADTTPAKTDPLGQIPTPRS